MSNEARTTERGNVTVKGELDLTDGNEPSVFGEGETVGGSTEEDNGETKTDNWPSVLDRDDWTEKQQRIIEGLATFPDAPNTKIRKYVGVSKNYVHKIRNRVRCHVEPSEVNFDIPDEPAKVHVSKSDWELYQDREGVVTQDDDAGSDTDVSAEEICRMYYDEDMGHDEVADELGISSAKVRGSLAYRTKYGEQSGQESEDRDEPSDVDSDGGSVGEKTAIGDDLLVCSGCGVGYEPYENWSHCPRCGTELAGVSKVSLEVAD